MTHQILEGFGEEFVDLLFKSNDNKVAIKHYGNGKILIQHDEPKLKKKDKQRYIHEFESYINSLKKKSITQNQDVDAEILSYLNTKELAILELCHPEFKYIVKPRMKSIIIEQKLTKLHNRWIRDALKLKGNPFNTIIIKCNDHCIKNEDYRINKCRFTQVRYIDIDAEISTDLLLNFIEKSTNITTMKLSKIRGLSISYLAREYYKLNKTALHVIDLFCGCDLRPIKQEIKDVKLVIDNIHNTDTLADTKSAVTGM